MEAAANLFYRQGIHQTSVDQVIAVSGLSKPTLYKYFRSKDELITAVFELWSRNRQARLRSVFDAAGRSPRQRLVDAFRYFETWFQEADFRGCALVNAAVELPSAEAAGRDVARRHKEWVTGALADLARDAGLREPRKLARGLTLLIEGATVTAYVGADPDPGRMARETAQRLIALHQPD